MLLFAQAAHGFSWLLLAYAGFAGPSWTVDFLAIAWIHTVALGWATAAALGVLMHVVPQFTEVRWRAESLARGSTFVFAAGVAAFVAALLLRPELTGWTATPIVLALLAYAGAAFATLRQALRGERLERAIARALAITLAFLLTAAVIGLVLAWANGGAAFPPWLAELPPAHADLAIFGWLSLLIFGVSARTVRPITGGKSRFPAVHIAVGSLTLAGVPLLAAGLAIFPPLIWPGAILLALGALAYAFDLTDIVRRAVVPHRVPQAFLLAGAGWLLVTLVLGGGALAGLPWRLAFGFTALAGWVGQMLDAHFYHIGVRLLLTIYRGDEDETRPEAVLDGRLSWISFAAFQAAVATGAAGLLAQRAAIVGAAGVFGAAAWVLMTANLVRARRIARAAVGADGAEGSQPPAST